MHSIRTQYELNLMPLGVGVGKLDGVHIQYTTVHAKSGFEVSETCKQLAGQSYSALKCSLCSLLFSSTKPALLRAVRRVDHVRSSSPV